MKRRAKSKDTCALATKTHSSMISETHSKNRHFYTDSVQNRHDSARRACQADLGEGPKDPRRTKPRRPTHATGREFRLHSPTSGRVFCSRGSHGGFWRETAVLALLFPVR